MTRRGRSPGARSGTQVRRRVVQGAGGDRRAEEMERQEESDHNEDVKQHFTRVGKDGRRGRQRRTTDEDADEANSADNMDYYDLNDGTDSTVTYAMELATKDEEQRLIEKALERIRRAHALGKKNIRLSKREFEALERKRLQESNLRDPPRTTKMPPLDLVQCTPKGVTGEARKRRGGSSTFQDQNTASYPRLHETHDPWGPQMSVERQAHPGMRPSSSLSQRPQTPSAHSVRSQQSNITPWPQYPQQFPPEYCAYVPEPRALPPWPNETFPHPLAHGPTWAPPHGASANCASYPVDQPMYQSFTPTDVPYSPWSQNMTYSADMVPYNPNRASSSHERNWNNTSNSFSPQRAPFGCLAGRFSS